MPSKAKRRRKVEPNLRSTGAEPVEALGRERGAGSKAGDSGDRSGRENGAEKNGDGTREEVEAAGQARPSRETKPFIEVENLVKSIGSQQILNGVDLTVLEGETMVVIGASGEGKSVLLKHLIGLMRPTSGTVRIDGVDISNLSERQLAGTRRKVGILFQNGALFDSMNVAANVAFPLLESGVKDRREIGERVHDALDVVELAGHKEKMPVNLSGGMRKRVALARAVISNPKCILYDEPTAGLDPVVSDSINHLIRRMQRKLNVTSIVVTHDMKSAYHVADRIAYLRGGKIYFLGTPDELRDSEDTVIQDFIEGRSDESKRDEDPR